jgi:hypothetical protein
LDCLHHLVDDFSRGVADEMMVSPTRQAISRLECTSRV